MYILIDKSRMVILYRHTSQWVLSNLGYIEIKDNAVAILNDADFTHYDQFTMYELKLIYKSLTGDTYPGFGREDLVYRLIYLCSEIAPSQVNGLEVTLQANAIPFKDQGHYKYVFGSNKASAQQEMFVRAALTSSANPAQARTLTPVVVVAHNHAPQAQTQTAVLRTSAAPKYAAPWLVAKPKM